MSSETEASVLERTACAEQALEDRGQTVACAESLTGGELAALLSSLPGASATFTGGVVAYATEVKRDLLSGSRPRRWSRRTPRRRWPGGTGADRRRLGALRPPGSPAPTCRRASRWAPCSSALAGPQGVRCARLSLEGDRTAIRAATCVAAVELLLDRGGG